MISIKFKFGEKWEPLDSTEVNLRIFHPFVVKTQKEKDYLEALGLMLGVECVVLLDGKDRNPLRAPPTITKVDLP